MNWTSLWNSFLNGEPSAIQTFSSLGVFITTVIGTIYIVLSFKKQVGINKIQYELNRLSLEKGRREIRPIFDIREPDTDKRTDDDAFLITLTNAPAFDMFVISNHLKEKKILFISLFRVEKDSLNIKYNDHIDINNPKKGSTFMTLYFKDELGRKYKQLINISEYDSKALSVDREYPELLNSNYLIPTENPVIYGNKLEQLLNW